MKIRELIFGAKPHLIFRFKKKGQREEVWVQQKDVSDEVFMQRCFRSIEDKNYYEWCYIMDKKTNKIVRDYI